MSKVNINELSLSTPVYHAYYGKGIPVVLRKNFIVVQFKDHKITFEPYGKFESGYHMIDHLHTKPVTVVTQEWGIASY